MLANFAKILFNVFGATRHVTTAMLNKYSNNHNRGVKVGLINTF